MNTWVAVAGALLSASPKQEQQRVANLVPFDVATCSTPKVVMPSPPNTESVTGALRLIRPHVLECLTDAKARGAGDAPVTIAASDGGVTVTGAEGPGKACIEKAASSLGIPAGSPAASSEVRPVGPAVKAGINAASDLAAKIRLTQPQWCDCYTGRLPAMLELEVHVKAGAATEVKGDSSPLAKCLIGKVQALELEAPTETVFPYSFIFIDSRADAEPADAQPELQFAQLDAIRARRSAETALAVGARVAAVTTYDRLVAKYIATKKPFKMVKELVAKCADLVKADDALIEALTAESKLDAHTAEFAGAFAAKDARWKNAADALAPPAKASAAELEKVKAARDSDAKVCPK